MSISVDYFFNHPADLVSVAGIVNNTLGASLRPYEGNPDDQFCRFLSLEMTLCVHRLDDDGDCDFSNFRYELGTCTPVPDADLREVQIGLMAMIPFVLCQRAQIGSGILVYDAQRLIGRYRQRGEHFYSVLDDRAFEVSQHLGDLRRRIAHR